MAFRYKNKDYERGLNIKIQVHWFRRMLVDTVSHFTWCGRWHIWFSNTLTICNKEGARGQLNKETTSSELSFPCEREDNSYIQESTHESNHRKMTGKLSNYILVYLRFICIRDNLLCLSGLIWLAIDRTWASNPISNILSASSNTKNVTLFKFVDFFLTKSMRRPEEKNSKCHYCTEQ